VGHRFGPGSREQLDNLLHLDAVLGEFMDDLDDLVGPGRWVMGFSADHGVMDAPESDPALRRIDPRPRGEVLLEVVAFAEENPSSDALPPDLFARLEALDAYGGLTPYARLRGNEPVDSITQFQRNGFFEGRHRDVLGLVGLEGYRPERSLVARTTVASHGSPWHYDRWVPLIFYGAGVEPGIRLERAATVDLAPTLAGLAGIRPPEGLDGRALLGG
jgi:arylsulfatase A-like enzyme